MPSPSGWWSRASFRRILRDLWNAANSLPTPRVRTLHVDLIASGWVEFRVVREADPISPDVLQALFDPFDANHDGTGVTIGLYLARALTVAHGGTIGVDQDDQHAAFWVRIPRHTHPAASRPDSPEPDHHERTDT